MNPHRQHTLDIGDRAAPITPPITQAVADYGNSMRDGWYLMAGAVVISLSFGLLFALTLHIPRHTGGAATPVHQAQLDVFPLDPLPDMRVDAFRAGYRAALEGGCKPPVLSYPLQSRP